MHYSIFEAAQSQNKGPKQNTFCSISREVARKLDTRHEPLVILSARMPHTPCCNRTSHIYVMSKISKMLD